MRGEVMVYSLLVRGKGMSLTSLALLLTMAVAAPGYAQEKPEQAGTKSASAAKSTAVLVSPDEDYRIGPGDVIEVTINDAPELSHSFRITASGTFLMSYIGRVEAKDKTPEELAKFIAGRLRGGYLKDPQVIVVVKEYNSRSYFIQGAVHSPGVYQIEGKPSLLTLLTLAGGPEKDHGAYAFVIRKAKPEATRATQTGQPAVKPATNEPAATDAAESDEAEYDFIKVNINALYAGNSKNNEVLQPGDIINIPLSDVFYVGGDVTKPGSFPLKEGTTVRQAISLAQGTLFTAALDRAVIFRTDANGKRGEVKVDLAAIMKGKKEDMEILANDILIVPNSRTKSIGGALLKAFGLTSVTRVPML